MVRGRCPLSGHDADVRSLQGTIGIRRVKCPACGTYDISDGANVKAREYILSGIARRRSDEGGRPLMISDENMDDLLASAIPPRDPHEVLDRVLQFIGANIRVRGDIFPAKVAVLPDNDYPIAFARNAQEFALLHQNGNRLRPY